MNRQSRRIVVVASLAAVMLSIGIGGGVWIGRASSHPAPQTMAPAPAQPAAAIVQPPKAPDMVRVVIWQRQLKRGDVVNQGDMGIGMLPAATVNAPGSDFLRVPGDEAAQQPDESFLSTFSGWQATVDVVPGQPVVKAAIAEHVVRTLKIPAYNVMDGAEEVQLVAKEYGLTQNWINWTTITSAVHVQSMDAISNTVVVEVPDDVRASILSRSSGMVFAVATGWRPVCSNRAINQGRIFCHKETQDDDPVAAPRPPQTASADQPASGGPVVKASTPVPDRAPSLDQQAAGRTPAPMTREPPKPTPPVLPGNAGAR
jgi:hypothetical protein